MSEQRKKAIKKATKEILKKHEGTFLRLRIQELETEIDYLKRRIKASDDNYKLWKEERDRAIAMAEKLKKAPSEKAGGCYFKPGSDCLKCQTLKEHEKLKEKKK